MKKNAVLSEDKLYRYSLTRDWGKGERVLFIGLNPSTADAEINDPTVVRCINFAKSWGYEGIEIVNLFAYRSKYPSVMKTTPDPVGAINDKYITEAAERCTKIVVCWSKHGKFQNRNNTVMELLKKYQLYALKINQDNSPAHPSRLPSNTVPIIFHT